MPQFVLNFEWKQIRIHAGKGMSYILHLTLASLNFYSLSISLFLNCILNSKTAGDYDKSLSRQYVFWVQAYICKY